MNSMKSELEFDNKSCVVTGSIVEGSFEFFGSGAVQARGWSSVSVAVAKVGGWLSYVPLGE